MSPFRYDVFLSHHSADKATVRRLAERLRADGLRVWFDQWCIDYGEPIYLKIEEAIEQTHTLALVMSPALFGSDWVSLERGAALFRDSCSGHQRELAYQVHGNVWEWTGSDWTSSYDGSGFFYSNNYADRRMIRGGAWDFGPRHCRAFRISFGNPPKSLYPVKHFRADDHTNDHCTAEILTIPTKCSQRFRRKAMTVIDKTFRTLKEGREWLEHLNTTGAVQVRIIVSEQTADNPAGDDRVDPARAFLENLEDIAVDTGIEDLAHNHDHYLYGHPRKP